MNGRVDIREGDVWGMCFHTVDHLPRMTSDRGDLVRSSQARLGITTSNEIPNVSPFGRAYIRGIRGYPTGGTTFVIVETDLLLYNRKALISLYY